MVSFKKTIPFKILRKKENSTFQVYTLNFIEFKYFSYESDNGYSLVDRNKKGLRNKLNLIKILFKLIFINFFRVLLFIQQKKTEWLIFPLIWWFLVMILVIVSHLYLRMMSKYAEYYSLSGWQITIAGNFKSNVLKYETIVNIYFSYFYSL